MKYFVIDRFEGQYTICEDKDRKMFAFEKSETPEGAKEGDVLAVTDEGELCIDKVETEKRRNAIIKKQNDIFR